MLWKKVILFLLLPMMFSSLAHLHMDHHEHHADVFVSSAHDCHCDGCDTEAPEKASSPRDTTPPQTGTLRLFIAYIRFEIAPQNPFSQPNHLSAHLALRAKQSSIERLASVQFLI